MTKPQPLKGKMKSRIGFPEEGSRRDYFEYPDIASAVEWLKEEVRGYIMETDIIEKIDKAFEDVVKESKENSNE